MLPEKKIMYEKKDRCELNKMEHLTFAKIEIRKMNQKWKSQVKNGDEK